MRAAAFIAPEASCHGWRELAQVLWVTEDLPAPRVGGLVAVDSVQPSRHPFFSLSR